MEQGSLCKIEGVSKEYFVKKGFFTGKVSKIRALNKVFLDIKQDEILGIVGESGCGKSTLAKVILGLERPSEGTVTFRGKSVFDLEGGDIRDFRKRAEMVFQDPYSSLNPKKTIFQIISKPLKIHGLCAKKELRQEVKRLLSICGLDMPDVLDRFPHEFSGGQRQRIGIARALATRPELVVLDEPTSALDVSIQAQIINLILELQEREKLSCLFISHDLQIVAFVSKRIGVMYKGNLVELMPSSIFDLSKRRKDSLHHPYTEYLLDAVPLPDPETSKKKGKKTINLKPSPSIHKDVQEKENYCPFVKKCPRVQEICFKKVPKLKEVGEGHFISCHML